MIANPRCDLPIAQPAGGFHAVDAAAEALAHQALPKFVLRLSWTEQENGTRAAERRADAVEEDPKILLAARLAHVVGRRRLRPIRRRRPASPGQAQLLLEIRPDQLDPPESAVRRGGHDDGPAAVDPNADSRCHSDRVSSPRSRSHGRAVKLLWRA